MSTAVGGELMRATRLLEALSEESRRAALSYLEFLAFAEEAEPLPRRRGLPPRPCRRRVGREGRLMYEVYFLPSAAKEVARLPADQARPSPRRHRGAGPVALPWTRRAQAAGNG